ncbi:MAG: hypothetical protein J6U20_04110 [Fibrobacter sp.]|nr:hypothetical protein [Fibrobacter sp.]
MNVTLLTVTFRDPIVRSLAMRAAANHDEGGWTCNTASDDPANRKYPTTINSLDNADATKTAADIIRWFEEDYGESLTDHGLDVKYEEV